MRYFANGKKKGEWSKCHLPHQPGDYKPEEKPTWDDCSMPWVYDDGKLVALKKEEERG